MELPCQQELAVPWNYLECKGDVADLPAMPVELKEDAAPLPKPYMRRYNQAEMEYWRIIINELKK